MSAAQTRPSQASARRRLRPTPQLPRPWLVLAMVLTLMLTGSVVFYQQQVRKAYEEARAFAQRELDLLATVIQLELGRGHYQSAAQIVLEWGRKTPQVVSMRLEAGNGFILEEYRRAHASQHSLTLDTTLVYGYDDKARLILASDLDPLKREALTLALELGIAYFLLALILVYLTWLIILKRREADALRASEAQLEEAQALAHLGSWDLDLATGKANWSREEYRILGYEPDAVEAGVDRFLARVHADDRDRVWAEMQAAMAREDGRYEVEHRVVLPDGSERIVLETGRVQFDALRRPVRMVGSTLDVTEARRAERELEAHRHRLEALVAERTRELRDQATILDQIHDAVISTDLNGIITGWNHGAERLYGYSATEAVGRDVGILYFERETLLKDVIQPLREKGAHEVEVRLRRKDGQAIDVLLSLSLRLDGEGQPIGMIGYSLDISARTEAQRLLQQRSEELAAANRELEAFAYSVSHDLRAPLRAIDGFSQALLEDYGNQLDPVGLDYLRRVRAAAQRMAELIDDLLKLSRVSRLPLQSADVNLSRLAEEIVAALRERQPERKVDVIIEPGLLARGDPGLLRTALENLIENAWKYTRHTEAARIEIGCTRTDVETVFHVRDNGVGFDMRYAENLFTPFHRMHPASEFEGTGIGLATVQRIIQRHGGRIWAQASPSQGASFFFTLGQWLVLPKAPNSEQNVQLDQREGR